jgi:hypothetical protein
MLFSKIPNSKHSVLGVKVEHGKSFAAGQCLASCAWKYQSRYAYVTTKDKKAVCDCLETTHKEKIDHSDDTFKCDGERHGHFAAVHNAITNDQIKTHGVSESGNLLEQPRSEYQRVLHLVKCEDNGEACNVPHFHCGAFLAPDVRRAQNAKRINEDDIQLLQEACPYTFSYDAVARDTPGKQPELIEEGTCGGQAIQTKEECHQACTQHTGDSSRFIPSKTGAMPHKPKGCVVKLDTTLPGTAAHQKTCYWNSGGGDVSATPLSKQHGAALLCKPKP